MLSLRPEDSEEEPFSFVHQPYSSASVNLTTTRVAVRLHHLLSRKLENDIIAAQTGVVSNYSSCFDMIVDQVAEFNLGNSNNPYDPNYTGQIFLNGHTAPRNGSSTVDLDAGQQIIMCSSPCAAPENVEIRMCSCTDQNGCSTSLGSPAVVACPTPAAVSSC